MILDKNKVKKILYGGDYNPEQWTEDIWEKDMEMFQKAGIDIVTLNVFNWAMLQPDEETYDFTKLDKTVDRVTKKWSVYLHGHFYRRPSRMDGKKISGHIENRI